MPPTAGRKKPASLRKRLALSLVAVLSSLALAEVLYRALRPAPFVSPQIWTTADERVPTSAIDGFLRAPRGGDQPTPHPRGTLRAGLRFRQFYDRPTLPYFDADGCIPVAVNELGFRDLPFDLEKRPGEYRVMTIGDSFTFGCGVRLEDTWSQVLERRLRAERTEHVEVINGGFAAGCVRTSGYVEWIASDGMQFGADLLILGFCLNDMGEVPLLGYPVAEPEHPWLGGASEILNAIQRMLLIREAKRTKLDGTLIIEYFPEPWELAKTALTRIGEIADEHDVRLLVAILPMVTQLQDDMYPLTGLHRMVAAHCAQNGIESVDLLPEFLGREETELWVHPTDQHPNDEGHRLIARGIYDYLREHPEPRRGR